MIGALQRTGKYKLRLGHLLRTLVTAQGGASADSLPARPRAPSGTDPQAPAAASQACLLPDGRDAFAVRVASCRMARRSIDVQYYIWHSDTTGRYLAHELVQAADRGVRVRVLLDDMDARTRDPVLVALNRHPRIQIRLFNPFATRSGALRTLREMFVRGSRLNHRMHNKSWIVDEDLAIVGGRNIGDEYFSASDDVNFIDMDALLTGAAVIDAALCFERYWINPAAVPVSRLRRVGRNKYTLNELREVLQESTVAAEQSAYLRQLLDAPPLADLLDNMARWSRSDVVRVVADDPRKAKRHATSIDPGVLESMIEALKGAQSEALLISPYFVPGAGGAAALRDLARRGVRVAVLTNSLAATDVAAVHSGYARYRESLLEGGVCLYELKSAVAPNEQDKRIRLGSSRASLHTKAAIIDRRRIFVGSFNIDPRSAQLNCEMGVWIDNAQLAGQMLGIFDGASTPEHSFSVTLDEQGRRCWTERIAGREVRHYKDPYASWMRRAITWLLGLLPIESQL